MTMASLPATTVAPTETYHARTARLPRVKIERGAFLIDHPDPQTGERLMADALGVADRDAMDGILRQLVRASATGRRLDKIDLAFMISMIDSIAPRDSIEAMLVAQMVSIHVAAMRTACSLGAIRNVAHQESASRALARLARTFAAQVEALNRHRNNGGPAITVQNLSVQDGGRAIVGNVTHHTTASQPGSAHESITPQASQFEVDSTEHAPRT